MIRLKLYKQDGEIIEETFVEVPEEIYQDQKKLDNFLDKYDFEYSVMLDEETMPITLGVGVGVAKTISWTEYESLMKKQEE